MGDERVLGTFSFLYNVLPDKDLRKQDPFTAEETNIDQKDK